VDALDTGTNDHKVEVKFVKDYIFYRYRTLRSLISDRNSHFCHQFFKVIVSKIVVTYKIAAPYQPQPSGQEWQ